MVAAKPTYFFKAKTGAGLGRKPFLVSIAFIIQPVAS